MEELKEWIINNRRKLHINPEVGYGTQKTAAYIKGVLDSLGYKTVLALDGTAVVAYLDLGFKTTYAFRSDEDGLPIREQTNLPFKSTNGNMHACGHDGHMSILLGTARLLKEHVKELKHNAILFFQPAEEGPLPGGAIKLIETHLLDSASLFFAFHVTNKLHTGECGIKLNQACAAPDLYDVKIIGKGGHAAMPENANNPIYPAAEIALEFKKLNEEIKKVHPYTVVSVACLQSGERYNVIYPEALIKGTARSFSLEERKSLEKTMTEITAKVAEKYHCQGQFTFDWAYDPVINDELPSSLAHLAQVKVLKDGAKWLPAPEMIGEDFSYYRKIAPTCLTWLGVRGPDQAFYDLHSPDFLLDENALINGSLIELEIMKGA